MLRSYDFETVNWDELIELYKYWSLHYVESQKLLTLLKLLSLDPEPTELKVTARILGFKFCVSEHKTLSISAEPDNENETEILIIYQNMFQTSAERLSYKDAPEFIESKLWFLRNR